LTKHGKDVPKSDLKKSITTELLVASMERDRRRAGKPGKRGRMTHIYKRKR